MKIGNSTSAITLFLLAGCSSQYSCQDNYQYEPCQETNWAAKTTETSEINTSLSPKLLEAVTRGNEDQVGSLLQHRADVNARFSNGDTILVHAIKNSNVGMVKLLVANNADVNLGDKQGMTPLMHVVNNGNMGVPKTLNNGQIVYIQPHGSVNQFLLDILVEHGADLEIKDKKGLTVLSVAAKLGNIDAAKYFVERSADTNSADANGWTPAIYAACNGNMSIVELLVNNAANINLVDQYGQTALIHAVQNGFTNVAKYLIQKGTLIHHRDESGATALTLAKIKNNLEVVTLLESNKAFE